MRKKSYPNSFKRWYPNDLGVEFTLKTEEDTPLLFKDYIPCDKCKKQISLKYHAYKYDTWSVPPNHYSDPRPSKLRLYFLNLCEDCFNNIDYKGAKEIVDKRNAFKTTNNKEL